MNFGNLLSRCDVEVFQQILGPGCIKLIGLLSPGMSSPNAIREILIQAYGESGLILDKGYRNILIDLLRPAEATDLCNVLGIQPLPTAFEALKKQSFKRGGEKERLLFGFFELGVPLIDQTSILNAVEEIVPPRALFDHQRTAARKIYKAITKEPFRVLLHMPTGSGKTRTAMSVVADYLRSHEPALVVWVAYSEELCSQAADEFNKNWGLVGDRTIKMRRFWKGYEIDVSDLDDGIVIAGLPKLVSRAKNIEFINALSSRCKLLVIDEAHQAVAAHYKIVLEALLVQSLTTALLGLTATPGRTWNNMNFDMELSDFFRRKKVTLECKGYANPIDYLVDNEYLAKANYLPLYFEGGTAIKADDIEAIKTSLDIPDDVLERLGKDELRNLTILNQVEKLAKKHKRIILFATSVHNSHLLAAVLLAKGLKAHSVTGRTPDTERARIIEAYKSDDLDVRIICNYGVLTTGFDAPKTSCAIIARPTSSLVLYSQMVGRAVRGPRGGGNKEADIITIVDSQLPGFGAMSAAFSNWDDVW